MKCSRGSLLLALCLVWGCAGTPQTDPPNFNPPLVHLVPVRGQTVVVAGGPGAAEPAGTILHIVNLDTQDPEVTTAVNPNGSFRAEISAGPGQTLRFQLESGAERSQPVDMVLEVDGLAQLVHPVSCFTTAPEAQLEFGSSPNALLQVRNNCDQLVTLSAMRLRLEPSAFSIGEAPTGLRPGESATVLLEHSQPGDAEQNVLLIEISSPALDRRAITLIGDH